MLQYLKFLSSCTLAFLCLATHAQNVFIIGSGASIQLSGNVILTLQDTDLENHGSLSLSSGNGRLIFRGSANNFIRGTGTTILDQLEIAKFANGKLLIGKNVGIRTGIWFTSGLLDLNNRVVTLSGNASLHNESENSYLTGINGGYIEITRMLNNPQSENPGNLGAMITSAQNPGQTTIRRGHQSQTVGGGLSSIHRYYDIIPENNAALSAQLRFHYRDAELNNSNEAQLDLQRSTDNSNWTNLGAHGRNASLNYVELNGVNQFSRWTLASPGTALPVLFLAFDVKCQNGIVAITWSTAQEINAAYFEVQASPNGSDWTTIGAVPAAGNSQSITPYQFNGATMAGKFYRVREVDADGKSQLTGVQLADCSQSGWQVWPNPVVDQLQISFLSTGRDKAMINVYDNLGRIVMTRSVELSAGGNVLQLPVGSLPAGHYLIEMVWKEGSQRKQSRFVKN